MKTCFTKILSLLFIAIAMVGESPAARGGPDAFGYEFRDTPEADGPRFEWIDTSASGAVLISGATTTAATLRLKAPWSFYGEEYSTLRVSRNGFLTTDLSDIGGDESNDTDLPEAPSQGGGSRVYVSHDNLELDAATGFIFYEYFNTSPHSWSSAGVHVITWQNVYHATGDQRRFAFQALLYDTGEILCQFPLGNPERGAGSTTGIQNSCLTSGLGAYVNRVFSQRRTVVFSVPPKLIHPVPEVDARSGFSYPELVDVGTLFAPGVTDFSITGSSFAGGALSIDPGSGVVSFTPPTGFLGEGTIDVLAANPTGSVTITVPVNVHSVIHVASGADAANTSLGTSWADPTNLHRALFLSNATTQIWLRSGTYYPDEGQGATEDSFAATFAAGQESVLIGGFAGTESLAGERAPGNSPTLFSGDITQNDVVDSEGFTTEFNSSNSVMMFAIGDDFRMEDCAITGVRNISFGATAIGPLTGGAPEDERATTFRRCLFAGNEANDRFGFFMNISATTALVENCIFRDGRGGIEITSDNAPGDRVIIRNCVFEDLERGLIGINRGVDVIGCTFRDLDLGGVFTFGTVGLLEFVTISDSLFQNVINNDDDFTYSSPVSITSRGGSVTDCRFIDNSNEGDGGAISVNASSGDSVTISRCQFIGNRSDENGGAASLAGFNEITVDNCLFSGNQSDASSTGKGGGAVFIDNTSATANAIVNCTFANNTAQNLGAAIYRESDSTTLAVENCIFWENSIPFAPPANLTPDDFVTRDQLDSGSASGISFENCLLQGSGGSSAWTASGGTDLGGNIDIDPQFQDAPAGNYRLSDSSPAINSGLLTSVGNADVTGGTRVLGAGQDIGAYETLFLAESRDEDLDGLPDSIERAHTPAPGSPTALLPGADLDGDCVPVLAEFYQGLNLTAPDAGTEVLILENATPSPVKIRVERALAAVPFALAEPFRRIDLGNLSSIASPSIQILSHPSDPTKEIVEWEFSESLSRSFYQLMYDGTGN